MLTANNRARRAVGRLFEPLASYVSEASDDGRTARIAIRLLSDQSTMSLRAFWAGSGWPADVRKAIEAVPQHDPWPRDLVLVAQHLSPGALGLLEERDANWVDEVGQARIVTPGLMVIREHVDLPSRTPEFGWSPSAIAIGEALLGQSWPRGVRTAQLARSTGWSPPQISQVLQQFDAQGWTAKYGAQRGPSASRELVDGDGLLTAWAAAIDDGRQEIRLGHRTLRDLTGFLYSELGAALDRHVRWALSGWAAAEELAPFVSNVPTLQVYVHEDDFEHGLTAAMGDVGLRNVTEGGRVEFIAGSPSTLALSTTQDTITLASAPRIYADLLAMGGRGDDAAANLKDYVIDPLRRAHRADDPPQPLVDWERKCQNRLAERVTNELPLQRRDLYHSGTWSATYRIAGMAEEPSLASFLPILRTAAGRETGWPPWWIPDSAEIRPRPINGAVECWLANPPGAFDDAAHGDFWRADPKGRLCLVRGYQEDSPNVPSPGTMLDLVIPIWRTGECLLHAARMTEQLGGARVQFMMRWTGLRGRVLGALPGTEHLVPPGLTSSQDVVTSFVETSAASISDELAALVRELVGPLFETFDFFEPPAQLYQVELDRMRSAA